VVCTPYLVGVGLSWMGSVGYAQHSFLDAMYTPVHASLTWFVCEVLVVALAAAYGNSCFLLSLHRSTAEQAGLSDIPDAPCPFLSPGIIWTQPAGSTTCREGNEGGKWGGGVWN